MKVYFKRFFAIFIVMIAVSMMFAAPKIKQSDIRGTGNIRNTLKWNSSVIKIGSIVPLTGEVSVYGSQCKQGIELAVEEINKAGGVLGKNLEVIYEDDECNAEKTVSAFKKLVTKDKTKFVIGSLTSGCTKAITDQADAAKVLQIVPTATADNVTLADEGVHPYVFRTCYADSFQGRIGGRFSVKNLNAKKAAILYDAIDEYSEGLANNFEKEFMANGGEIVAKEVFSWGERGFSTIISSIADKGMDVIYLPDYYPVVALIVKQLRDNGILVPVVGVDGWDGLVDAAGEEVLNCYYSNHFSIDSDKRKVHEFVVKFKAKNKAEPTVFSALGYDSVYILKTAIENAGTADDVEEIRKAMENLQGAFVTGNIRFDKKHNPVKSVVMLEIVADNNGKLTAVYNSTVD